MYEKVKKRTEDFEHNTVKQLNRVATYDDLNKREVEMVFIKNELTQSSLGQGKSEARGKDVDWDQQDGDLIEYYHGEA